MRSRREFWAASECGGGPPPLGDVQGCLRLRYGWWGGCVSASRLFMVVLNQATVTSYLDHRSNLLGRISASNHLCPLLFSTADNKTWLRALRGLPSHRKQESFYFCPVWSLLLRIHLLRPGVSRCVQPH